MDIVEGKIVMNIGVWLIMIAIVYAAFRAGQANPQMSPEERMRRQTAEGEEIAAGTQRLSDADWAEIDRLTAAGKKIEAIKILRNATGLGLKLSKRAVEQRAAGR